MADKKTNPVKEDVKPAVDTAPEVPVATVLHAYRVEKVGNDAHLYERIELPEQYANEKGVKTFEGPSGEITYYTERLVKKYSDNVVSDDAA